MSRIILCMLMFLTAWNVYAEGKCVQIYYNNREDKEQFKYFGKLHAQMLQNLLGHFPEYQQYVIPIRKYKKGDIERCQSSIYLGTAFATDLEVYSKLSEQEKNNIFPPAFLDDFVNTKKNVLWAGYNVWLLGPERLKKLWGVSYKSLSGLDVDRTEFVDHNTEPYPGFFRYYSYKGEEFIKYAGWGEDKFGKPFFQSAYEIILFDTSDASFAETEVLSKARHSTTQEEVPYILRRKNHFYIADSPFSFMTEEDRYLIFSDIIFDVLDEEPRYKEGDRPAIIRIEDVHAQIPNWQLLDLAELLERHDIYFSMSLIPEFYDPFGHAFEELKDRRVLMNQHEGFTEYVHRILNKIEDEEGNSRVSYIYHGVTHQSGDMINMFNGLSGDDFEFWNRNHNCPMEYDSAKWLVQDKIEYGQSILQNTKLPGTDEGINVVAWLTPHYQASAFDYKIFSQLFTWNVGRIIYFPLGKMTQKQKLPEHMSIDQGGTKFNGKRLPYFADVEVEILRETKDLKEGKFSPNGQFFPYEIYGDVYGQRLIPENVGNPQPFKNEQVYLTQTIDDLIAIMKRNRVIRDAWASYFVHPFRLEETAEEGTGKYKGDTDAIDRLIRKTKEFGYKFIDLKKFTQENRKFMRPEPIEINL